MPGITLRVFYTRIAAPFEIGTMQHQWKTLKIQVQRVMPTPRTIRVQRLV